ncbi:MAG TPA: hypothetical protein ENI41_04710 [Deltaproteobacteria bacterium]|nr:MAG: hypothetical protein DRG83_06760 [Deltaproteobacteria bacterium]HEC31775.1 hypothetical protein [Deltaproteobacteria bacterium]
MIMEREIFNLQLSVEATSAYILMCSLQEKGKILTDETISPYWQGTDEQLKTAIVELKERNIIQENTSSEKPRYVIKKQCDWSK